MDEALVPREAAVRHHVGAGLAGRLGGRRVVRDDADRGRGRRRERAFQHVVEQRQHQRAATGGVEHAGQPLLAGFEPLDRDQDVHERSVSARAS